MKSEREFQLALDYRPDDHNVRVNLSHLLKSKHDDRAEGYNTLGLLGINPDEDMTCDDPIFFYHSTPDLEWYAAARDNKLEVNTLPYSWYNLLPQVTFDSRQEAEDAAAITMRQLDPQLKLCLRVLTNLSSSAKTH